MVLLTATFTKKTIYNHQRHLALCVSEINMEFLSIYKTSKCESISRCVIKILIEFILHSPGPQHGNYPTILIFRRSSRSVTD